jgi:hypothetical protein
MIIGKAQGQSLKKWTFVDLRKECIHVDSYMWLVRARELVLQYMEFIVVPREKQRWKNKFISYVMNFHREIVQHGNT